MGVCGGIGGPGVGQRVGLHRQISERRVSLRLTLRLPRRSPQDHPRGRKSRPAPASACKAWLVSSLLIVLPTVLLLPASAECSRRPLSPSACLEHDAPAGLGPTRWRSTRLASHDPVALATVVAERYWGAVPCGGQVTVLADQPLPAGLEPTTDGWVTFDSSLGQNDLQAPASTYTQCTISLAHWQWPTRCGDGRRLEHVLPDRDPRDGSPARPPHSLVPGSVMAPVFTNEANVPRICRTTRPSGARVAGKPGAKAAIASV